MKHEELTKEIIGAAMAALKVRLTWKHVVKGDQKDKGPLIADSPWLPNLFPKGD